MIVGEDLGTVPQGFRERLAAADVLSFQPLWFQRDGTAFQPPSRYSAKAVACVSTHDLPTIAGWWNGVDIAEKFALNLQEGQTMANAQAERRADKEALATAVRGAGFAPDATFDPRQPHDASITRDVHRFIGATTAATVLIQADDLAAETMALNLPGTDRERPNWRRKVAVDAAELWHTECGMAAKEDFAGSRGRAGNDGEDATGTTAGTPVDPGQG